MKTAISQTTASVLVGLLWCLALLAVVVVGLLHAARMDLMVVKNQGDLIQAHYLALAGVEKTKALLYQNAAERRRSKQNHNAELFNAPNQFKDVPFGRGQFRIFRCGLREEGGGVVFGVSDEESRLNVNQASAEDLVKLTGLLPEIAAAMIDWRDGDNAVTTSGAEAEYYMAQQPPYLPRNGPFETTRELLRVRGVTRDLLLGEDSNQNGLLDPEEDDGTETDPPDNRDGLLDGGWSSLVTVNSSSRNVNAAGQDRVNIQSASESALAAVPGLSSDLAKAIVAYRGQNRLENLADLLDVTPVNPQSQSAAQANPNPNQPPQGAPPPPQSTSASSAQSSGQKLISEDLLMDIADDLTAGSDQSQSGAINLNTASPAVLACLPGITPDLAQAIVSYRKSAGFFPNIACLLKVSGMTRQIFKQVAPRVTVRSETFRILSEGRISSTGVRKRIEVICRVGPSSIETLSYREDL